MAHYSKMDIMYEGKYRYCKYQYISKSLMIKYND